MTDPSGFALDHLERLSDNRGLFEHAEGTLRREEHGYCTDDNARLLMVMSHEPDRGVAYRLGRLALGFVLDAQDADGRCHNRMDRFGRWTDRPGTDDCWGRAQRALGMAAAHHGDDSVRDVAFRGFERGVSRRSKWPRAMAFAALGAVEVLASVPDHGAARALLIDALDVIGPTAGGTWRWTEPRLAYANATLAEAIIAAAAALDRPLDVERGLAMLAWLLALETPCGHLSVTSVHGRGPGDIGPQFDQQPIEAAAMADASWRAYALTGDSIWSKGIDAATGWFIGENDTGLPMFDDESWGGFDGLQPEGVNLNQGAESTLALISTMQRARSFVLAS